MSASRPARRLLSAPSVTPPRLQPRCRNFHSSPSFCERRRPQHPNVKASDMGLINHRLERIEQEQRLFKPYTDEDKQKLAQKYTPEQIEVIEAGEKAITPQDLNRRGVIRTDQGRLGYLDDFSVVQGTVDRQQQFDKPIDPTVRLMEEDEYGQAFGHYMSQFDGLNDGLDPDDPDYNKKIRPNRRDMMADVSETPKFVGEDGAVTGQTTEAPGVPKFSSSPDITTIKTDKVEEVDERDPDGVYKQLQKQTGYTLDEILAFKVKNLVKHRVVNQTRLGKVPSQYILAIAGDGKGKLGLGQAKGQQMENTLILARIAAIRNMQPIPRYEDRTIFGEVEAKVSAVTVKLMSRPPGFGLRCQHLIFEMARAAGLQDLAARVPRSRNKMNTVKATYQALMNQRIPDEVARGRGLKLVDVRKVYYGGRV